MVQTRGSSKGQVKKKKKKKNECQVIIIWPSRINRTMQLTKVQSQYLKLGVASLVPVLGALKFTFDVVKDLKSVNKTLQELSALSYFGIFCLSVFALIVFIHQLREIKETDADVKRKAQQKAYPSSSDFHTVLVVGETGDGKSTLINSLCEHDDLVAEAKMSVGGTTKNVFEYPGKIINGIAFKYIDTPGIGDHDVTPIKLLSVLESHLNSALSAVIVTSPVTKTNIGLGAQIVQSLVEKGIVDGSTEEDKWSNIILVGTKNDRAEPQEREHFITKTVPYFFSKARGGNGPFALTGLQENTSLIEQISKLTDKTIKYIRPDSKVMAGALSEKLGVDPEVFRSELTSARAEMRVLEERRAKERAEYERNIETFRVKAEQLKKQLDNMVASDRSLALEKELRGVKIQLGQVLSASRHQPQATPWTPPPSRPQPKLRRCKKVLVSGERNGQYCNRELGEDGCCSVWQHNK
eukprot:Lithocolla_globosa_v1_NODE_772_length_3299_cov_35.787916.p1 type:complete len:467 gc:universal NODE_772_length_3299_cov_35.787916:1582-2982(+)